MVESAAVRGGPELMVLPGEPEATSIGEMLGEARERQRISLHQAEQATRIKREFLDAMERDDFGALPGTTYAKGFLKTYSRFLGLDPQTVIAAYREQAPQERLVSTAPAVQPIRHPRPITTTMLAILFMLILAGAFSLYLANQLARYEATRRALASASPAVESPAGLLPWYGAGATAVPSVLPTPAPSPVANPTPPRAPVEVEIRTDDRVWLQVDVDGTRVVSETFPAGTTHKWQGNSRIVLYAGNAPHLLVTYNGRDLGPLSKTETVVQKAFEKQP